MINSTPTSMRTRPFKIKRLANANPNYISLKIETILTIVPARNKIPDRITNSSQINVATFANTLIIINTPLPYPNIL